MYVRLTYREGTKDATTDWMWIPERIVPHNRDDLEICEALNTATRTNGAALPELWAMVEPLLPKQRTRTEMRSEDEEQGDLVEIAHITMKGRVESGYTYGRLGWARITHRTP